MKNSEIIHQIVIDKIYKNNIQFKIELDKVFDKKLVSGLLIDMLYRNEIYELDKEEVQEIFIEYELDNSDIEWTEARLYFLEEFDKICTENVNKAMLMRDILIILYNASNNEDDNIDPSQEEYVSTSIKKILVNKTQEEINFIKDSFIEKELYEYIKYLN
jgi:hypothetical protein